MEYRFSTHARARIAERKIPDHWLQQVLRNPQQTQSASHGRTALQSVFTDDSGKLLLLRVIVENDMVITAMLTSKIEKYGRAP